MGTVIFKTDAVTLPGVLKHAKHALQVEPKLSRGDTILIAQTLQSLRRREKQIRYRMGFVRSYLDTNGETDRIWHRHWRYVVEGTSLKTLRRPIMAQGALSSTSILLTKRLFVLPGT